MVATTRKVPAEKRNTSGKKVAAKPVSAAGKPSTEHARKTTEMLHLRIDDTLKTEATKTLKAIGFTLSDALRLFLHRVVVEKALPLRLDVPNAATRAAIEEVRSDSLPAYKTPEELFDALEKGRTN